MTTHLPPDLDPRDRQLLELLACPSCTADLDLVDGLVSSGWIVHADLVCPEHGRVGVVDGFRPSFLPRELDTCPLGLRDPPVRTRLDMTGAGSTREGRWLEIPLGLEAPADEGPTVLQVVAACTGFTIYFHGHDWAGIAEVQVDDSPAVTLDLYRDATGVAISHEVQGLADGMHTLRITATGHKHPSSVTTKVLVTNIEAMVPPTLAIPPVLKEKNRGNGYHYRFLELMTELPNDALVLDCGGGDRCLGDPRAFNLEYLRFELPDLYGDGLCLPVQSNTFDLVYSQAVLEHVPDPQRAVDELVRITKPGGTVFLDVAFMQALHAVPFHYFNVTPHGIEHLCRGLERVDSGWTGGIQESFGWWLQIAGADRILGPVRHGVLLELLRQLDEAITHDVLKHFAFSVHFEGRKPEVSMDQP